MSNDIDEEDSRMQGVEFGPFAEQIEEISYPIDKEELVEEYGDTTLEMEDGEVTVRELLEPLGDTTFEEPFEVKQSVLNMVGNDAVGRDRYSDRGGESPSLDEEDESF